MTIVLLASVSLLALAVTSRPVLSSHTDLSDFASTPSTLRTSAQAAFRIHAGEDRTASDAAHFHLEKSNQQIPELGRECVAAIPSYEASPGGPPVLEFPLDGIATEQDNLDVDLEYNDNRLDDVTDEPVASELMVVVPTSESPSAPLVVLVFSCAAAFLALACIALTLYIIKSLRSKMLASTTAWELLLPFWRCRRSQEHTSALAKQHFRSGSCFLLRSEHLLDAEERSAQRNDLHPGDKPIHTDVVSDTESEWDDVDEKYQDALDMTPLPPIRDLPFETNVCRLSHLDDSPLPHSGSYPLDPTTADRSIPMMYDICTSPVSRPAWSVRAMDSPTLGLSSRQGDVDATLQPLVHPRRRAYRSPVPEFDVALAMQLRPGLGIGADSAWMVRFLMAIFGWFAVALTSSGR